MKNLKTFTLGILLLGTLSFGAIAQQSGTIVYDQIINIHKNLSPEQQAFKAMLPETITKKLELRFNENYARLLEIKQEQPKGMQLSMSGASSDAWFDFIKKEYREYHKIMGELFYVRSTFPSEIDLQPTGNTKKILGYNCQEMKSKDGEFNIWFTTELNLIASPMLPLFAAGTILSIESEKLNYNAIQFIEGNFNNDQLNQLPAANLVSLEQLEDLQEEALEK